MPPVSPNRPVVFPPCGEALPEFWPDQSPPTVRPVWIPWPIAVLLVPLFWVMPRRFGPHFAAASWTAAVIAHLVWGIYGAVSILLPVLIGPQYSLASYLLRRTPEELGQSLFPVPTLGEILRGPLALLAGIVAEVDLSGPRGSMELTQIVTLTLLAELGLVLSAVLLMPFIAAGERTRRLLGRTIKLVLWASTSLVVLAVAIQVLLVRDPNAFGDWSMQLTIALYCAWVMWLVIRGGSRYAGPAEGPAWERASPLCVACGYGLTALPCDSACPECGQAIGESLPEFRSPSPLAAGNRVGRLSALPVTYWRACGAGGFTSGCRPATALPAARRFAVWIAAVTSALLLGLAICGINLYCVATHQPLETHWHDLPGVFLAGIWLALGLLGLIGLAALVVSRFGWRPLHVRPSRLSTGPPGCRRWRVSILAAGAAITWLLERPFFSYYVNIPQVGRIDLYVVLVSLLIIVPGAVLWRAVAHLVSAVKAVRYANG